MTIVSRNKLKEAFAQGKIPSQEDFGNLIDSLLHQQDDGFISQDEGLRLSPKGDNKKIVSFFQNLIDLKPQWSVEQYPKESSDFGINLTDAEGDSRLFIHPNGNVGIGTLHPTTTLEVGGNVNMQGRRGTFSQGKVPGDGEWHNITPQLNQCHGFEVIAQIGKPGRGMYAMTHAFALSTFGRSSSSIQKTSAYYGSFRNKLDLRWHGETFNYVLQIRSKRDYGSECMIKYYVTNLWWEEEEVAPLPE